MKKLLTMLLSMTAVVFISSCEKEPAYDFYGSIYGMITDAQTNAPVVGAQVMLSPGNFTTVTGSDGHYEFQNLDAGQYKLSVYASGYSVNTRQVTVVSGESVICDMQLTEEQTVSGMELSTNMLDFGSEYDELTFSIRNTGTSGDISWYIDNITVGWITVSPAEGTTEMGKSSSVKVTVQRGQIPEGGSTTFNVNAAGGSLSVMVTVAPGEGGQGGDNPGGGEDNPGGEEDYSSATVESGDSRITAEILSCKRSGSSVTLTYVLKNEGLGSINDFRIYTTNSNSLINGAYRTVITDENYNNYVESDYTFNGASQSHNYVLNSTFPEGTGCKGTVTVKDFDRSSEYLTVILGIWCYDLYPDSLADPRIYFENVPVY